MHSHYGVGTSTEPIVISDDEEEAAFVEYTLEQRISSPSNSEGQEDSGRSGWPQGQPIYVEDEPAQTLETGNDSLTSDSGTGTLSECHPHFCILYTVFIPQESTRAKSANGQQA